MNLIMGLVGMATLILIAVLFSSNRKAIKIRTVGGAFAIQAGLGVSIHRNSIDTGKMRRSSLDPTFLLA